MSWICCSPLRDSLDKKFCQYGIDLEFVGFLLDVYSGLVPSFFHSGFSALEEVGVGLIVVITQWANF
jgi:hypothetical protein